MGRNRLRYRLDSGLRGCTVVHRQQKVEVAPRVCCFLPVPDRCSGSSIIPLSSSRPACLCWPSQSSIRHGFRNGTERRLVVRAFVCLRLSHDLYKLCISLLLPQSGAAGLVEKTGRRGGHAGHGLLPGGWQ